MRLFGIVTAIAVLCCGCSTSRQQLPHAIVDDVSSVKPAIDSGYRVMAVDGEPVERMSSSTVTMIPNAIIPEGKHTLTLESKDDSSAPLTTATADFEAEKHYRLEKRGKSVVVVKHTD